MKIFILDVPMIIVVGMVAGYLHGKHLRARHPDFHILLGLSVTFLFWLNALLSNLHVMAPWFARHMVVPVNTTVGIFYVLSYPLWFIWAGERTLGTFGRTKEQGGLFWPFTLMDKTEPFKPLWSTQNTKEKE